ncbi:MAG: Gfo/Idh/MocA family oxidoreductase [Pseudomonadota bacterium]
MGCGRIAQRHAFHIRQLGRLIATCDIDLAKAQRLGKPAAAYEDIDQMLARHADHIDVVVVCTPNGRHADHAVSALKAGCHVLCEKPMAVTVAACGEMIKAAERANRRLFIVKQSRYNPPVRKIKDLIDDGVLGRLYSAHLNCFWNRSAEYYAEPWKGSIELDGGTLFTQFSHFLDLLLWLAGDVKDVAAFTGTFARQEQVEFEDAGAAILRFQSGAIGSVAFTINAHERNMEGSLTLICERGTVKIGGQYLNELEYQNIENHRIEGLPEGRPPNEYGHYQGAMSNHEAVYENLIDVLDRNGVITTAGYEAMKTVELITRIYETARGRT